MLVGCSSIWVYTLHSFLHIIWPIHELSLTFVYRLQSSVLLKDLHRVMQNMPEPHKKSAIKNTETSQFSLVFFYTDRNCSTHLMSRNWLKCIKSMSKIVHLCSKTITLCLHQSHSENCQSQKFCLTHNKLLSVQWDRWERVVRDNPAGYRTSHCGTVLLCGQ